VKAITLWGPWAQLIPLEIKHYETRSWATKYRGLLAIHAAKKIVPFHELFCGLSLEQRYYIMRKICGEYGDYKNMPTGAIVATCNLVDCIEITARFIYSLSWLEKACGDYTLGRYAWILDDVKPLRKPIPAIGRQGLWNWKEAI